MSKQNSIQHAGSPEVSAPARVPWAAVATFIAISFGLAWVIALPVWLIDKDRPGYQVLFTVLASVMMFTPAIATLVVMLLLKVPMRGNRLRLLGVWPLRPAKRVVWFTVAAVVAPLLLTLASLGVAAAFGWLTLDLVHFSGFQQTLDGQFATLDPATAEAAKASLPPLGLLVGLQLLAIPFGAVFNSIFAFGEEIGWRGWLLPALRPLGTWPALLLSGVIWGLWHAPLILLGYNFNRTDFSGVLLMVGGCVAWGVLFGWARLRTGSVWPAVVGHGALNASAGLFLVVGAAEAPFDPALVSPLGVAGWIVLAAVTLTLALTGQFKRQPQLAGPVLRPASPNSGQNGTVQGPAH
ncbi:MAG: CPBP family intramembrane metalloprotease [Actinobacteria bacterium]|nr:CPBP family intramembrane metalloprotease [Actinomycetota bacterium]